VYCEMIVTPEQVRRKAVAACQAALTKRGVAVLVVPADVANADAHDEPPYAVHARVPLVRPSDGDLDEIAAILNKSEAITIYAGAGCAGAHDEVVATTARLQAPMVHTSRGKDFLEYDNPYNGTPRFQGGRTRRVHPNVARAARSRVAACQSQTDAAGDAAFASSFAGVRGRYGRL
jgi:thiamine pyrophosphate-dependent acetolactate synthase large subunit-like protein